MPASKAQVDARRSVSARDTTLHRQLEVIYKPTDQHANIIFRLRYLLDNGRCKLMKTPICYETWTFEYNLFRSIMFLLLQ